MNALMDKIGSWAFITGVVIAIIAGFFTSNTYIVTTLVILGLIVGLLNVTRRETRSFIVTTAILVVLAAIGGSIFTQVGLVGEFLARVLTAILTLAIPAGIIVCLRGLYIIAED